MKTFSRSRLPAVIWGVVFGVLAFPAGAACPLPSLINQNGSDGTYGSIVSPGQGDLISIRGNFWALGFGNPTGAGHDNGTWPTTEPGPPVGGWLAGSPPYLNGDWGGDPRVDGCATVAPVTQPGKTVVALSDATPLEGFFNVSCTTKNASADFNFKDALGGDIVLAPIPRIVELHCSRPAGTVYYTLNLQALTGGIQPGDCGSDTPLVTGYNVYWRAVPLSSPPPAGRDRGLWNFLAGPTPLGADTTTSLSFMPYNDVHFAATLVFDSGFETAYVSGSTAIYQCPPILADPPSNNIRRIKKSDATPRVE